VTDEIVPAPTPAPTPTPAPSDKPWYDGVEPELLGHFQARGLDKKTATEAAISEAKAYREASKLIGAPPESMVRIPKEANDTEGWQKVHERLGVPSDPAKYDFSGIKFADGTELNEDFVKGLRASAGAAKLSIDGAKEVAKFIVGQIDADEKTEQAEYAGKLAVEKDTLAKNWGSNAASNMVIAQNAAKTLGIQPEEIKALEGVVGYARVMDMLRNIGARTGEDKFVKNEGTGLVMTKEQAQSELALLEKDTEFFNKLQKGDVLATQRYQNLTRMASGQ
jgi:hypothetical protein